MQIKYENLVIAAELFAGMKHASQVRKYTGQPYITHPKAVAALVRLVSPSYHLIAAALLHDVVEDTDTTNDDIRSEFGDIVADLVEMVTNVSKPSDGNRAARKAIERDHLKAANGWGATIKLADIIDNTRDIAVNDPDFARVYIREKLLLLPILEKGDRHLWNIANTLCVHYDAIFGIQDYICKELRSLRKFALPAYTPPRKRLEEVDRGGKLDKIAGALNHLRTVEVKLA